MERVARIGDLARWLHGATGKGDVKTLTRAAEVLKSDLATGMVGEFPDLQGVMGRVYALHEGLPQEVADAIFEHYLPRGAEEMLPKGDTGALLGIADRIDQLAGIFSIGKAPTGTSDAFGLRRAAIGLLRIVLARRYRFDLRDALAEAQRILRSQPSAQEKAAKDDVAGKVWAFVQDRLSVILKESAAPDSIQAVLATRTADVVAVAERLSALTQVREKNRTDFENTAATFKRIANILAQAQEKKLAPMAFDPALLRKDEPSEAALAEALSRSRDQVGGALEDENYLSAYAVLAELRPAVDRFFEDVMVMHEDAKVRDNRLALLRSLHELFSPLADFSRLQLARTAA
jgi:glycyl-tRNA synthetase beta chain